MPGPYQPSLLRLLHGLTALLVPLAWLTGLQVYSSFDGRFGRLPFTLPGEWIDIHGTVGVVLWPIALLFGLYALTAGRARLRQPAKAIALLALALAVGSGKLMNEDWLRDGQFAHLVYGLHLLAWLLIQKLSAPEEGLLPPGDPVDLDHRIASGDPGWRGSPEERFERRLCETEVQLGLLFNGCPASTPLVGALHR